MNTRPTNISVTSPLTPAFERVKQVLFNPFDLGKWFAIGFCAWLAGLGERGGFNSGFNFNNHHGSGGGNFRHEFDRARDYVMNNLTWIIPVVIAVVVLAIAIGLVLCWLNSRGKFMFLHCVALNRADVAEPWNKFSRQGNSLFLFRVVLSLIGSIATLPLVILAIVPIFKMALREEWNGAGIVQAIALILLVILIAVILAIIRKITMDFVVPIMFLRNKRCVEAWGECRNLFSGYVGELALYILFQIVIGIVIGTLILIVVLATCCIAGCFMALPYIGTVLLLPVLVFKRAYSLYFLAQFGREYDVFPPAANPPVAFPPGAPT